MSDSTTRTDLPFILALTRVKGLNCADIKKLLGYFETGKAVFSAARDEIISVIEPKKGVAACAEGLLRFDGFKELEKEIQKALNQGISLFSYLDEGYPAALKQIPDPPPVLYVRGEIIPDDALSIAVVGTRSLTNYGRQAASALTREIAARGITIVSGLARGIDSEAHQATLEVGGRTIAVMGTGQDVTYPSENKKLRENIERQGASITEFGLGEGPEPWHFPARNRIIAGMSMGTLVVEAPEKSGALITARLAMEYDREVFAVPGNITSNKSSGCNKLIRDGAKPVFDATDVLEEFELMDLPLKADTARERRLESLMENLSEIEKIILDALGREGALAENVIQASGLAAQDVCGTLLQMELKGLVRKMPGNVFVPAILR